MKIHVVTLAADQYRILKRTGLSAGFDWSDIGLGLILPDAGLTTTRDISDSDSSQRFFRVEAIKPLSP